MVTVSDGQISSAAVDPKGSTKARTPLTKEQKAELLKKKDKYDQEIEACQTKLQGLKEKVSNVAKEFADHGHLGVVGTWQGVKITVTKRKVKNSAEERFSFTSRDEGELEELG